MRKDNPALALKVLAEWWQDMGVDDRDLALAPDLPGRRDKKLQGSRTILPSLDAAGTNTGPPLQSRDVIRPDSTPRSGHVGNRGSLEQQVDRARHLAASADTLAELKKAIESFDGSPLKKLCAKTVVHDGVDGAPVMVLGEGPGQQEDRTGLPFVGKAGQLLDKMLAAIGLDRKVNVFVSNVNYWRPPGNRNPEADELAVCRPFVERMIVLVGPRMIIAAGNVAAKSLLATSVGITRLRGNEHVFTPQGGSAIPLVPIFHPAYLLRRPEDKVHAWRDLLFIKTRLQDMRVMPAGETGLP